MSEPTQTNRKKSRRRNGDGNTYRHKNGWRTVISHKGHTVTAMGRSEQESRRLAKEKIKALPIYDGSLVPAAPTIAWSMVHGFAGLAAQGATGNSGETLASKRDVLKAVLKSLDIN